MRSFDPSFLESRPNWSYAVIVGVLFIAVIAVNRYAGPDDQPQVSQSASIGTDSPAAETLQPVATTGSSIQIEMRAQGPCWVRAVVDGQPAFARLMQPGESEALTAQRDLVVRVGDPSAFSYSINGKPGQSLGTAQVPVTVRFEPDGRFSHAS